MSRQPIELADVIRRFADPYRRQFGDLMLPSHHRAIQDIAGCMTPAMGGGRYRCTECNETFWCYHGCRNRSCPKCHGRQTAAWLESRSAEILPCRYFHLVATVPAEIRHLFLRHQKTLYGLLMKTAADVTRELAAEQRYVGGEVGILAVLHTWTARLHYHPHVHLLVTGGGVAADRAGWHDAAENFLVPVKRLSPMIAGRFAQALKKKHPDLFDHIPAMVWKREWCSYCKPYGTGTDAVLHYLGRYVFRIAVTNHRLIAMDESHVTFAYKDHATEQWKTERVEGVQFLRRFLLHVLPKGFHKVRYYGLWHPGKRALMARARLLLALAAEPAARGNDIPRVADCIEEALERSNPESPGQAITCPKCNSTRVILIEEVCRRKACTVT